MDQNGGDGRERKVSITCLAGVVSGKRKTVCGKGNSWNPGVFGEIFTITSDTSNGKRQTYREEYPAMVNR